MLNGNAEAVGTIQNPSVNGSETEGITPRDMPNEGVFDYYLRMGTHIDVTDIEESGGVRVIEKQVLSPASNPYGATNPEGIYIIDCGGATIEIGWSRMVATLVLLNVGPNSKLSQPIQWSPAVANYPALLVDGDFGFDMTGLLGNRYLLETSLFVNFNPTGTPYQGESDTDESDSYPGVLNGIVYVSGAATILDESFFNGVVIANSIQFTTGATFDYDSVYLDNPPPGFRLGDPMEVIPGSWKRVTY